MKDEVGAMGSPRPLLIQVVPRLKPGRCGLSDHAIALAQELDSAFAVRTAFVVLNSPAPFDLPFPVTCCTDAELLDACASLHQGRPGAILVHLSGYGYSPDGAPARLAAALAQVKADRRFRIAVYFHELFATGAPWKSAFWHSRRQKNAVRSIAELSDLVATNTHYHAAWLQQRSALPGATSVQLLPVFSTVGEALQNPAMESRTPAIAVFGLASSRLRSYKQLSSLGKMLHSLGIERIWDIGLDCGSPGDVCGIPVQQWGELPAAQIAGLLSKSVFGFTPHPDFCMAKSSIFAAYCAYGAIPVLAQSFSEEMDGIRDGVHVASPNTAEGIRASGLDLCSNAAWNWYSNHRLHVHAQTYWQWLSQPAPVEHASLSSQ